MTGTIDIELADNASTYLGWLLTWGTPVTLLADSSEEIETMQRQLVRIGIDRPAGQLPGGPDAVGDTAGRGSYEVSDFAGLAAAVGKGGDLAILDTRRQLEWADGHLPDAVHIPLHELEARIDEVPRGQIWVHCASGYRSSIAASLLARAGRDVVLVDDEFDAHAPEHFERVIPDR